MEYGYCNVCKKHLLGGDYTIKNGKKICSDCSSKSATELTEKNNLLSYIRLLFQKNEVPASWLMYIEKQRKQGRTYSGMQGTLYYFYELMGNAVSYESMTSLGIIDYVYDEAKRYFEEIDRVNQYNSKIILKEETRRYNAKLPKNKKIDINIGDL